MLGYTKAATTAAGMGLPYRQSNLYHPCQSTHKHLPPALKPFPALVLNMYIVHVPYDHTQAVDLTTNPSLPLATNDSACTRTAVHTKTPGSPYVYLENVNLYCTYAR